jgi:uncharacterized membrane protein
MNSLRQLSGKYAVELLVAAVVLAGLCLRLYHLGFQSLWLDEIHTAIESDQAYRQGSLLNMLLHVDQQPPLFFLLEQAAIFFLGNTESALRLVPVLAGTASIWAMYRLSRELSGKKTGLYAALFMTVNAFCIHYSQEARPYSLALFFSILSWLYFVRLVRQPGFAAAFCMLPVHC